MAPRPRPRRRCRVANDSDDVPDPEMDERALTDLVLFTAGLAAPEASAGTEQTERGRTLFSSIGCASCHVPEIASAHGQLPAYTDLLLHDMGEELADGIVNGDASASEFRTPPLWGIIATHPYLHDGRAATLGQAIEAHGGEASAAAAAAAALPDTDRAALISFLSSLGGSEQASEGRIAPGTAIGAVGSLGGPLRELREAEATRFLAGRSHFDRDRGALDGLGTEYNGDSCRGCHFDPVPGGAGPLDVDVNLMGTINETGRVEAILTGAFVKRHALGDVRPEPPAEAVVFDTRETPMLLGLGLLERVPDETLLARARIDIEGCPDVSGDYRLMGPPGAQQLGRFGWQASVPMVRSFARGASFHEMGITQPTEVGALFGDSADGDAVEDPEMRVPELDQLAFFISNLAPPPRLPIEPRAEAEGRALFDAAGCACCHLPELETADGVSFHPYTDLLLHDVAAPGARAVPDGLVSDRDFRTAPLWGGRADTAVHAHRARRDPRRRHPAARDRGRVRGGALPRHDHSGSGAAPGIPALSLTPGSHRRERGQTPRPPRLRARRTAGARDAVPLRDQAWPDAPDESVPTSRLLRLAHRTGEEEHRPRDGITQITAAHCGLKIHLTPPSPAHTLRRLFHPLKIRRRY